MLPMSFSFLAFSAVFVGVFLLSFLDPGDDSAEAEGADFTGTDDDDALADPLGGKGGHIDLLAGDDTLEASDRADTVFGGPGDDEIYARLYNDYISGGSGTDHVEGNYGNDTLEGGAGDDTLLGDSGDDLLRGGDDDDLLQGGKESDTLDGGAGDDTLEGGEGRDLLRCGNGDDVLNGTYGAGTLSNTLDEDLADTLDGGAGDDTLILGSGDTGTGGAGADGFTLDEVIAEDGPAVITDFDPSADLIELEVQGAADPSLLTIENFADDSGATILYDGTAMAEVTGAQNLAPDAITLIEV